MKKPLLIFISIFFSSILSLPCEDPDLLYIINRGTGFFLGIDEHKGGDGKQGVDGKEGADENKGIVDNNGAEENKEVVDNNGVVGNRRFLVDVIDDTKEKTILGLNYH